MQPEVQAFFHKDTYSLTYLVIDPGSRKAAVIDSVLDYDAQSGRVSTEALDQLCAIIAERGLEVEWILETHPHADHMTGAGRLREGTGGRTGIGRGLTRVHEIWRDIYNLGPDFPADGGCFDRLFDDGDSFAIGAIEGRVLHTPGHTPACLTYVIGDAAFVGDVIFMPDFGTARVDFPEGDAHQLYRSIRRILDLPPETRIFVGHDYGPGGRDYAWETTVAVQRAENKHVHDGIDEDTFVAMRLARDKELSIPGLLLPALQVNIRGGALPEPEVNGTRYLKIPIDQF